MREGFSWEPWGGEGRVTAVGVNRCLGLGGGNRGEEGADMATGRVMGREGK